MRTAIFVVLLAFLPCAAGVAQQSSGSPVRDVSVCDLLQNPRVFDRQLVRYRGRLYFEFEGDHVDGSECTLTPFQTGIWWTYGGDDLPALEAERKQMLPLVSPIRRDAAFDTFKRYVYLRRSSRPDHSYCHSNNECSYYDVEATFTGRFFSGKPLSWRQGLGGFGHRGCCHLFVIEQISDVTTKRTQVPPDDTPYSCTSVSWQAEYPSAFYSGGQARGETNKHFLIEQAQAHGDDLIAQQMEPEPPFHFLDLYGSIVWSSRDLLLSYTAEFVDPPSSRKKGEEKHPAKSGGPAIVAVNKQTCQKVAD